MKNSQHYQINKTGYQDQIKNLIVELNRKFIFKISIKQNYKISFQFIFIFFSSDFTFYY